VAGKGELGWRFPCDGPGRGGSCQVSSWDHVYLGLFWAYNLLAVVLFYWFWRLQSELWCSLGPLGPGEQGRGAAVDWPGGAVSVGGWLRDFLWAESAQVVAGYGGALAPYTLLFLLSHFVWSLSLMFLFSGRGYWQELAESLLWAHLKLGLVPSLSPRALSITGGRAAGVVHFLMGGVGASWSFSGARLAGA
jgi:photosystem I P700 chlorophyll a apoprotein A1